MPKLSIAIAALIASFLLPISVGAYYPLGEPAGFVTDGVPLFSPIEEQGLESVLSRLQQETGVEFSIVAVKSLDGDTIENFSRALFEDWGIGQKGKDNGLLLFISYDRIPVARLEVGYGLEGIIPDLRAKELVNYIFNPRPAGARVTGMSTTIASRLMEVVAETISLIEAEIPPQVVSEPVYRSVYSYQYGEFAKWFVYFVVFNLLAALLVRGLGLGGVWWFGGLIGAVFGYLTLGWIGAVVVALVGLFIDFLINKKFRSTNAGVDAWVGGTQVPSSQDFGGFGGGRSGGGGASA